MPQTTQSNLITTLEGMGVPPRVIGCVQGYIAGLEYAGYINRPINFGSAQPGGTREENRASGGSGRPPTKAMQAILSVLTTTPEGLTSTAITKAVGSAVRADRITPTLQNMKKAELIYDKDRRWFPGAAATTTTTEQAQEPRRPRGRPPKTGIEATATGKAATRGFNLSAAVLQAVNNGFATPPAIIAYLQQRYGETVRSNHVGIALQRHRRQGRLALTGENNWMVTETGQQTAQAS